MDNLHMDASALPAVLLLLCRLVHAQQLLLPGSCNFELGSCGYTSDPNYGRWSMNEEGKTAIQCAINMI